MPRDHRAPACTNPARRRSLALAGAALWSAADRSGAATASPRTAPEAGALPALARGVNLTRWFEYERTLGPSLPELQRLRRTGLDHVRIPLDPGACGWQADQPARLPFLPALQQALDDVRTAGLVAILDLHLEPAAKARVEADPALEAGVVALWSALAQAMAGRPPAQLALHLYNEPQYYGRQAVRWPPLQARLMQAVRQHLPGHLVLLSPQAGGSLAGLLAMAPVADPAVAYTFHHYEPFVFTHQGVPWLDARYTAAALVTGLDYPAAADAADQVRYQRSSTAARREVQAYADAGWNAARVAKALAPAGEWARRHGARVLCTEFGAFRATVPTPVRARWLSDSRLALEAMGVGWTVWDYTDHFGLTATAGPGQDGRRLDPALMAALGLAPGEVGRAAR